MTNKDFKDFATSVVYHIDFEDYFKNKEQDIVNQWKIATDTETREKLHTKLTAILELKQSLVNIQENGL